MNFELTPPSMDKGWSFQAFQATPEAIQSIAGLLNTPIVNRAKPFLQGNCLSSRWFMVEFWTDNEDAILTAALFLQGSLT